MLSHPRSTICSLTVREVWYTCCARLEDLRGHVWLLEML
jgi:hypothetical protein